MFTVSVETHFRASHQLGLPDGSKEPLHWHDWSVVADVSSDGLNNTGVVMDFSRLKAAMDGIVAEFIVMLDEYVERTYGAEKVLKG